MFQLLLVTKVIVTCNSASGRIFCTWDGVILDVHVDCGGKSLECPLQRGIWVLVDGKLDMSQQHALVTKRPTLSWGVLGTVQLTS